MTTLKERLTFLGEEAKEVDDELTFCIYKIKADNTYMENIKALEEVSTKILQKTFAYLTKKEVTDSEVTRLKKMGLVIQLYRRVEELMPEQCQSNCLKVFYYLKDEVPLVRCRRCGKGACRECHPHNNLQWKYLCSGCDLVVASQCDMEEKHVTEAAKKKEKKEKEPPKSSQAPGQEMFGLDTYFRNFRYFLYSVGRH